MCMWIPFQDVRKGDPKKKGKGSGDEDILGCVACKVAAAPIWAWVSPGIILNAGRSQGNWQRDRKKGDWVGALRGREKRNEKSWGRKTCAPQHHPQDSLRSR